MEQEIEQQEFIRPSQLNPEIHTSPVNCRIQIGTRNRSTRIHKTIKTESRNSQAASTHSAVVHDLIAAGAWILPCHNSRHRHVSPVLTNWLANFNAPLFDLGKPDVIIQDGRPICKMKIWHMWDTIRYKMPTVSWHKGVWHRLAVARYAHHLWLVCHGRINTLQRLASFGMGVLDLCYLCVGGRESLDHLLLLCSYNHQILSQLGTMLGLPYQATSWLQLLHSWILIINI